MGYFGALSVYNASTVGFIFLQSPKHFQVPQIHFKNTRAQSELWDGETVSSSILVAFDDLVDEEDLRVAKSWGGDTELAGAKSFEENCATLLSESRG